jgi:hypothetical protein
MLTSTKSYKFNDTTFNFPVGIMGIHCIERVEDYVDSARAEYSVEGFCYKKLERMEIAANKDVHGVMAKLAAEPKLTFICDYDLSIINA